MTFGVNYIILYRQGSSHAKDRFTDKERNMTTLVIDRHTLPETLLSFIGSPRVLVSAESDRVVLTPVTDEAEFDGPDGKYIDPADYEDETAYLSAIPGLVERFIAYRNLPASEFEDWDD